MAITIAYLLSGCSDVNSGGEYGSYNCNQLSMERSALADKIQQATEEQSTKEVYELAMAAFALSNGNSYNAQSSSGKLDSLQLQFNEVHEESIRKQCNW